MADGGRGSTTEGDGHRSATVVGCSQTQAYTYTKTPVSLKFRNKLLPPSSGLTVYLRDSGSKFL
jgi:hypothetical protein